MSDEIEKSLLDIDFASLTRRKHTPSPALWEDQTPFFLLVDCFSDGHERGGHRNRLGSSPPPDLKPWHPGVQAAVVPEE